MLKLVLRWDANLFFNSEEFPRYQESLLEIVDVVVLFVWGKKEKPRNNTINGRRYKLVYILCLTKLGQCLGSYCPQEPIRGAITLGHCTIPWRTNPRRVHWATEQEADDAVRGESYETPGMNAVLHRALACVLQQIGSWKWFMLEFCRQCDNLDQARIQC